MIDNQKKIQRCVLYETLFRNIGHSKMVRFQNMVLHKISSFALKLEISSIILKGSYMTFL